MARLKIGSKVVMRKSLAKWYLDHPDIFVPPSGIMTAADLREEAKVYFLCFCAALDEPVIGIVVRPGSGDCWGVEFKTPYGYDFAYYDSKNLKLVGA